MNLISNYIATGRCPRVGQLSFVLFLYLGCLPMQVFAQDTRLVCDFKTHVYQNENYHYVQAVELLPGFEFTAGEDANGFTVESATKAGVSEQERTEACEERVPFGMTTIYVKKENIREESELTELTEEELITMTEYVDGLGRGLQEVIKEASPQKRDMIQPTIYDQYGRAQRSLMGYTSTTTDASFHPQALEEQLDFFENGLTRVEDSDKPFADVFFEPSPLNRVIEAGAQGEQWQLESDNIRENHIETNVANEVRFWREDENGDYISDSFYPENTLIKTLYTDEQGNRTISFVDPFGLEVYTRAEESGEGTETRFAETYKIYDDFLRLVHVISPEGVVEMNTTNNYTIQNTPTTFEDNWVNSYAYDVRHRTVEMRMQGSEVKEVVYDRYNREVTFRNAEQRALNEWSFVKYDYLGRPVTNGIHDQNTFNPQSRENMAMLVAQTYATQEDWVSFEVKTESNEATYTETNSFPNNNTEVLNTTFYDHLDFNNDGVDDHAFTFTFLGNDEVEDFTLNKVTGTKTRIVGTANELERVIFYDEYQRGIQVRENNELNLALQDYVEVRYNDEYEFEETAEFRSVAGNQVLIKTRSEYDHLSRLTSMFQANEVYNNVTGGVPNNTNLPEIKICEYTYNELGIVIEKNINEKVENTFLQSMDYSYNIRGWMTHMNNSTLTNDGLTNNDVNDLFGMELLYTNTINNQTRDVADGNDPRFDGLLSGVKWQTKHTTSSNNPQRERSYNFQYDKLNRLTDASYAAKGNDNTWLEEQGAYDAGYSYDLNGNMKSLFRYALQNENEQRELIDDLVFSYENQNRDFGNRLQQVIDQSTSIDRAQGYRQQSGVANSYTHNQNGNITFDVHQNVAMFYNQYLNLTTKVERSPTEYIEYTLTGLGERLAKRTVENGVTTSHLHYIGSCVYDFEELQYYLFPEGRARVANAEFTYEYHIKDHLGNVRVMFEEDTQTGEAIVTQENHYYPYGLKIEGIINNQPIPSNQNTWLFNGQEFQNELGLNWYAFHLRCYDPSVGRWFEQDPYNEFFTPYNGMGDNPTNLIDVDGGRTWVFNNKGDFIGIIEDNLVNAAVIVPSGLTGANRRIVKLANVRSQDARNNAANLLRNDKLSIAYNLDAINTFYNQTSNVKVYDKNGQEKNAEHATLLIQDAGGLITTSSYFHTSYEARSVDLKLTYYRTPKEEQNIAVADLHSHANSEKAGYEGAGPSFEDNEFPSRPHAKNGVPNVVVDHNNIYFYYGHGSHDKGEEGRFHYKYGNNKKTTRNSFHAGYYLFKISRQDISSNSTATGLMDKNAPTRTVGNPGALNTESSNHTNNSSRNFSSNSSSSNGGNRRFNRRRGTRTPNVVNGHGFNRHFGGF